MNMLEKLNDNVCQTIPERRLEKLNIEKKTNNVSNKLYEVKDRQGTAEQGCYSVISTIKF